MTNLLDHPQFGQIRVEKEGEDFLFCAKDVCDILDLTHTTNALQSLDDDEKLNVKILHSGQHREMLCVTESGLYALIIRSNKPAARNFRKWITSEVLPSLRKYGVYSVDRKVMDRAEKRAEEKAVKLLLREIERGLSPTDRRMVARQCQADEYEVYDVLSRRSEDCHMLALLYGRATGNRDLRKCFYTREGAMMLLAELSKRGVKGYKQQEL
jgi:prophage antirepressor-like protein